MLNCFRSSKTNLALALGALALFSGCRGSSNTSAQSKPQVWVWGSKGPKLGQFKGPRAIIVAKDGFVYVADRASRVSKWTKDGKCVLNWMAPVVRNGRFEGPEGITDLPDGDLAVTNTHANRVLIYSPDGKLKSQFGSYGMKPGQFLLVTGITADKDGFIYCSDYGGQFDRVSKWTKDGKLIANWPGHGEGPRQFRRPCGLAISKAGDLLVADIANHRVQILDKNTGVYKGQFSVQGRANGQMTYPYGVAVDGAGLVYTVEYSLHRVQKWSSDGKKWLATWGGPGRLPGQLANPWGLSVDKDGTVYVADTNNDRVQKFHF
ncbi:serine/threonine-protein kinase PknD [Abditibacteriota bacterium]|nr:serine/threonine-protein kinase PknD [Abditibacteriota bacterium]